MAVIIISLKTGASIYCRSPKKTLPGIKTALAKNMFSLKPQRKQGYSATRSANLYRIAFNSMLLLNMLNLLL